MSALATAVQAIPAAAIAPASACASAIHYTFLGLRNRSLLVSLCARLVVGYARI